MTKGTDMTISTVLRTTLLLGVSLLVAGCEAIAGIFEAGFWVGAIIVLIIVGLIAWLVSKGRSRG
jgi:choline-glycine betaine transporter